LGELYRDDTMRCKKHREKILSHLVSIEPPLKSNLDKSLNWPIGRVNQALFWVRRKRYLFGRSVTIYASRIQFHVLFREHVDEVLSGINGRHGYACSPSCAHVACSLGRTGITIFTRRKYANRGLTSMRGTRADISILCLVDIKLNGGF